MCEVIDKYINIGIEQGLRQAVRALMDNMNLSLSQAMTMLKTPSELQEKLRQ